MADVVSLGGRLKQRRAELGLSQAQAARELDVARTAYRLWEMEAAQPSPDRWRLISRWLGISVTSLLLADELISEAEAAASTTTEADFARSGRDWDTQGEANVGDFFQQGRTLIQDGVDTGFITPEQADELATVLGRLEAEQQRAMTTEWASGELRKAFPATPPTARAARQAVSLVAADIPPAALETAQLLTSELVTNSIKHSLPSPARIGLCVEIDRDRVRIEVSHSSDAPSEQQPFESIDGYGLKLVESLASRWDTTRDGETTTTWFELDLPLPGTQV